MGQKPVSCAFSCIGERIGPNDSETIKPDDAGVLHVIAQFLAVWTKTHAGIKLSEKYGSVSLKTGNLLQQRSPIFPS